MAKTITSDEALRREYHTWLRLERGYSPNTIEGYEMDLDKLRAYGEAHKVDIVHMGFDELQDFVFEQFKDISSEATQARILAGIHSWFRFCSTKTISSKTLRNCWKGRASRNICRRCSRWTR